MTSDFFRIRPLTKRQGRNKAVFSFALLIILFYPYVLNPFQDNLVTCYFKEVTGINCPTCGLSRSIYELTRFHIAKAFSFHFLGPFFYAGLVTAFFKFSTEIFVKKEIIFNISSKAMKLNVIFAAGLWLIFWLYTLVMQGMI